MVIHILCTSFLGIPVVEYAEAQHRDLLSAGQGLIQQMRFFDLSGGYPVTTRRIDITGPVSPYCILSVRKKAKALLPSDELIITCDSVPAATTFIPQIARSEGLTMDTHRPTPNLWEISLKKEQQQEPGRT
jgi:TusA-related sulfurtransferase